MQRFTLHKLLLSPSFRLNVEFITGFIAFFQMTKRDNESLVFILFLINDREGVTYAFVLPRRQHFSVVSQNQSALEMGVRLLTSNLNVLSASVSHDQKCTANIQMSSVIKHISQSRFSLQSLKNDDTVPKKDVQRILELSHKQRQDTNHDFCYRPSHHEHVCILIQGQLGWK